MIAAEVITNNIPIICHIFNISPKKITPDSIAIIGSIVDKIDAVLASRFFRPDVYNKYARTVAISDNAIDGASTSIFVN